MAYKYDPILRMNVPVMTTDAEVAWQEFDRNDRVVTKRKEFKSIEAAEKFIEKVSEKNNFYRILATSDAKTADANTIIESAKAYVKDAERLYNAAKRAKEDFFSTRDEYANRIRTYWVRNKQNMSSEEEEACKSAISKLNGMSYF